MFRAREYFYVMYPSQIRCVRTDDGMLASRVFVTIYNLFNLPTCSHNHTITAVPIWSDRRSQALQSLCREDEATDQGPSSSRLKFRTVRSIDLLELLYRVDMIIPNSTSPIPFHAPFVHMSCLRHRRDENLMDGEHPTLICPSLHTINIGAYTLSRLTVRVVPFSDT